MVRLDRIERDAASRQQGISPDEIIEIVRRAFGSAATLGRAEEIGAGTVNSTYRLTLEGEEPGILRVGPTRKAAASGPSWLPFDTLQREHALTPYLAPVASLLPKTLAADFTHRLIDRDWVIQTVVPGEPWSELVAHLTGEEGASLWRQLGAITRQIHGVEGHAFGPLPPGSSFPRWSDLLLSDASGIAADFARFGLPDTLARALRGVVASDAPLLDAAGPPRLIHSDLDQRHVFITRGPDGQPVIAGIIDHEFGRFADPLSESLLLTLPDRPDAAPFFETYGPLPNDPASHRRRLIYQAIALGWTAGDQAHQGQDTGATLANLEGIMRDLGPS